MVTYWRVHEPAQEPLKLFAHLLDADGIYRGGEDRMDVWYGNWQVGDMFAQVQEIRLDADAIPVNPSLDEFLKWREGPDIPPAVYALDSGEEFELLLTLPADNPALEEKDLGGDGPLTVIGSVESGGPEVILEEGGKIRPILPGGWSHRRTDGCEE